MHPTLPGELSLILVVAVIDAVAISFLGLLWYRRRIGQLMRTTGESTTVDTSAPTAAADGSRTRFTLLDGGVRQPARPEPTPTAHRAIILAYTCGALAHAAVITALELTSPASAHADLWTRLVQSTSLTVTNMWPLVPAMVILLAQEPRALVRFAGAYLLGGALLTALATFLVQVMRWHFSDAPVTNAGWFVVAVLTRSTIALPLLLLSSWHRVRGVMPLALAAVLMFGIGTAIVSRGATAALDVEAIRSLVLDLPSYGAVVTSYYGLFLAVSLPMGWLAWRLLRTISVHFEHKRFSDVQLVVDCWWLVVTLLHVSIVSTGHGPLALAGGVGAFAAYRSIVAVVLGRCRREPSTPVRSLLLLRVLGHPKRTQILFDRIAQHWRFRGPVHLLGAPDLAMRMVSPANIIEFLRGRLSDRFVRDPSHLLTSVGRLDRAPDPDGRFRVNGLFCNTDTWRPAFQAMLESSDAVLMDLRSFAPEHKGCTYELQQLALRSHRQAIALLIDRSTDVDWLAHVFQRSPRGDGPAGTMTVIRTDRGGTDDLRLVRQWLHGTIEPGRVVGAADIAGI